MSTLITKDELLFYRCWTRIEGAYNFTYLDLYVSRYEGVNEKIGGCVDNVSGYGDQAAADRVKNCMVELRRLGFDHVSSVGYSRLNLTLKWQHYEEATEDEATKYCEVQIRSGDRYSEMKAALKLYEAIGREIIKIANKAYDYKRYHSRDVGVYKLFETPAMVIDALQSMKRTQEYSASTLATIDHWHAFVLGKSAPSREEIEKRRAA